MVARKFLLFTFTMLFTCITFFGTFNQQAFAYQTEISGKTGDGERSFLESAPLTGIKWEENGDDPCYLVGYFDNGDNQEFDECNGSLGNEKGVYLDGDGIANGIRVCNTDKNDKLKGIQLYGVSNFGHGGPTDDIDEHANCEHWDTPAYCNDGDFAIGYYLYTEHDGKQDFVRGIALECEQL